MSQANPISYDHMSKYDIATLAGERLDWISTLIYMAKQNRHHADTLLGIAEYLANEAVHNFDEMAQGFEQSSER